VVLFAMFGAIGIALTFLLDTVMRRYVKPETRERANSTASVTLQVTATIYAILIAFVIVDAYNQIRATQGQISDKAASLSIIFENSRAFPDAVGGDLRDASLRYARAVVETGFPRLEHSGNASIVTDQRLEELFHSVQQVEPASEAERAAYASTVDALDSIVHTRDELITSAKTTIPGTLLGLLFVIGMTVMAVATVLDTRHRRSHLFILSALALVIWLTLALVVSMTYPFSGPIAVTDAPLREFVEVRAAR
jgi:NADH:ubiquinone oxidoreductase subunit 6 (subunit J)